MKKERVVLAFIAAIIGLFVAGVAFYIYQSSKTINVPNPTTSPSVKNPAEKIQNVILNLTNPPDESVINNKVVQVSGNTKPDATIIVLTELDQKVVTPSSEGDFSTTVNINSGENIIEITAIAPNGEEKTIKRTVTFSTENF